MRHQGLGVPRPYYYPLTRPFPPSCEFTVEEGWRRQVKLVNLWWVLGSGVNPLGNGGSF